MPKSATTGRPSQWRRRSSTCAGGHGTSRGSKGSLFREAQEPRTVDDKSGNDGQTDPRDPQSRQGSATPRARPLPGAAAAHAPQAQAEWHAAPESVRGEIHRMAREFHDAYQRSQADVQEMEQIRPFQQMARQHGTSLQRALQNYTGMEQIAAHRPGRRPRPHHQQPRARSPDGQQLGVRDIAYHILNLTPEQHRLTQSQNAQMAQSHQLAQLHAAPGGA